MYVHIPNLKLVRLPAEYQLVQGIIIIICQPLCSKFRAVITTGGEVDSSTILENAIYLTWI